MDLDIAGVPIPEGLDGRSLLPLVREPDKGKNREDILGEFGPVGIHPLMLTDGTWTYIWLKRMGRRLQSTSTYGGIICPVTMEEIEDVYIEYKAGVQR